MTHGVSNQYDEYDYRILNTEYKSSMQYRTRKTYRITPSRSRKFLTTVLRVGIPTVAAPCRNVACALVQHIRMQHDLDHWIRP